MLQATVRVCRLADAARAAKRVCDSYTPWRRLRRACRSVSGCRWWSHWIDNFWTIALQSSCLHQNGSAKITVYSQCKICVNGLNTLCWVAGSGYASQWRCAPHILKLTLAFLQTLTSFPDLSEPLNWLSNSPDLNLVDYSIWVHFSCSVSRSKTLTAWK